MSANLTSLDGFYDKTVPLWSLYEEVKTQNLDPEQLSLKLIQKTDRVWRIHPQLLMDIGNCIDKNSFLKEKIISLAEDQEGPIEAFLSLIQNTTQVSPSDLSAFCTFTGIHRDHPLFINTDVNGQFVQYRQTTTPEFFETYCPCHIE